MQLVALRGTLAPAGALALAAAAGSSTISGPARVAESEDAACRLLEVGTFEQGDVIVLLGQGPRGGPGMPSCRRLVTLCEESAVRGMPVTLVTDGRAPAGRGVVVIGAVTPEAAAGGPLTGVQNGDLLTIDLVAGAIDVDPVRQTEPREHPARTMASPVLWKYAEMVGPATSGARTHPGAATEQHCYADL